MYPELQGVKLAEITDVVKISKGITFRILSVFYSWAQSCHWNLNSSCHVTYSKYGRLNPVAAQIVL